MTEGPNAQQATYWNEGAGPTWVELQAPLDRQLAPLGQAAMAALAPKPGERILDIGCGAGNTTLELARAVAPDGRVTGADISHTLLEVARRRGADMAGVRFVEADVQVHSFEPGGFDAVFSRFGVMFFSDPTAAFVNIRRALKPGGRLAFVCWRTPAENPIMSLPMAASRQGARHPCRRRIRRCGPDADRYESWRRRSRNGSGHVIEGRSPRGPASRAPRAQGWSHRGGPRGPGGPRRPGWGEAGVGDLGRDGEGLEFG